MEKSLLLVMVLSIGLVSCERKPDCEKNNFGTVRIVNYSGEPVWVDCTQDGQASNEQRILNVDQSTEFQMTPGNINLMILEDWDYPDGNWHGDPYNLAQCEVLPIGINLEDLMEPCEKQNFGTVIVTNNTGQVIWVDCTQEGDDYNEERMLGVGQETIYIMEPGMVTEWAIEAWGYPSGSWYTATYMLNKCDVHDDPWTSGKKSSVSDLVKGEVKIERKTKSTN